ncbi:DEAD-domain-containing protein [Auriculariales sp. MPI-PUGE-AT-0066]|nr:DEAD-domain-containing protein [Auriculariales sp. MPI-PUGE-AT-0066]
MESEIVSVESKLPSRSLKRKARGHRFPAAKRTKRATLHELAWRSVARPSEAGLDEYGDVLELEEVEGVDVIYEGDGDFKVAKFQVAESSQPRQSGRKPAKESTDDERDQPAALPEPFVTTFDATLLPAWSSLNLHPQLAATLYSQSFKEPTAIQSSALPPALAGRDVIGVAETGSGKTLAYGLPILHHLLTTPRAAKVKGRRSIRALILAPTRELALQVCNHLKACLADPIKKEEEDDALKRPEAGNKPPAVSVAAVVGGMSAQKQKRVLERGVDVLVATPGRLWDILGQDDALAAQVKRLRFLVVDEADRMIQAGHFAELDNILRLTVRVDMPDEEDHAVLGTQNSYRTKNDDLQTFVFSATLSKDLQHNFKRRKNHFGKAKSTSTLDDLLMRLDFRDPEPEVIDLSPEGGVVATLQESKIECLGPDKDAYLYYFLLRYPGRTVVFLSAIDGIRRLAPLMELLQLKSFVLHSELQQKQRLKTLDRFKANSHCVLLATDVAARGLDVPSVDHVIHYQLPRSADAYVHRNGRTARARADGFALMICSPEERRSLRLLMGSLSRTEDEIPELPVDHDVLDKLKARITVARRIDSAQHAVKKANHERKWTLEAAEALGVDVDSDLLSESDSSEDEGARGKRSKKSKHRETQALRAELKAMLAKPVVAKGISAKFITSGSRSVAHELAIGESK